MQLKTFNGRNSACCTHCSSRACPSTSSTKLFINAAVPRAGCSAIQFILRPQASAPASSSTPHSSSGNRNSSFNSSLSHSPTSGLCLSPPSFSLASVLSPALVLAQVQLQLHSLPRRLTIYNVHHASTKESRRARAQAAQSQWMLVGLAPTGFGRALTPRRPCKTRKIKCGEEKPKCHHCERQGETCDYSIRLNWEGRTKRKSTDFMQAPAQTPTSATGGQRPGMVSRPLSEPNFGGPLVLGPANSAKSQVSPGLSGASTEFAPVPKTESVRDAYSLEATAKGLMVPLSPYEASFGLRANPKIITDLTMHHNGRLGGSAEDDLVRTTMADMSFVGMHGGQPLTRDHISASQLSRIRDPSSASYPSPTDSSLDSPPLSALQSLNFSKDQRFSPTSSQMPPPSQNNRPSPLYFGDTGRNQEALPMAGQHPLKRPRMSPPRESSDPPQRYRSPSYSSYHGGGAASLSTISSSPSQQISFRSFSPSDAYGPTPFTSAVSSARSVSNHLSFARKAATQGREPSPDRRLSVSSLLADPLHPTRFLDWIDYGVDRGFPDEDLPTNNDHLALDGNTPTSATGSFDIFKSENAVDEINHSGFGFGLNAPNPGHGEGGYYARPVQVLIPRSLGNLPDTLQKNPMNLLYFHHFLNHTARILVPHDCSENPFKSILPQSKPTDYSLLQLVI